MAQAKNKVEIPTQGATPKNSLQEILDGMTQNERIEWLDAHCHVAKQEEYHAPLSAEDLDEVKDYVTNASIKMQELEDKKQRFMDELKIEMKPLKEKLDTAIREARLNERNGFGVVYYVPVHELGLTYRFAEGGTVFLGSRPMTAQERQMNLLTKI